MAKDNGFSSSCCGRDWESFKSKVDKGLATVVSLTFDQKSAIPLLLQVFHVGSIGVRCLPLNTFCTWY